MGIGRPPNTLDTFFSRFFIDGNGCWIWTGGKHNKGYALFSIQWNGKKYRKGYRFSYEYFRGPIPEGRVLDHVVCDNPPCVNPWHMEPATNKENVLRGIGPTAENARKDTCKNGHPYNKMTQDGRRYCSCRNKRMWQ